MCVLWPASTLLVVFPYSLIPLSSRKIGISTIVIVNDDAQEEEVMRSPAYKGVGVYPLCIFAALCTYMNRSYEYYFCQVAWQRIHGFVLIYCHKYY